ncbi:MAG: glycosyltransferase [Bacteroidales bacterium]|nr:glycosyltransferase [Bacteroidales bacterium]
MSDCLAFFRRTRTCAIVPTYNNAGTVLDVIGRLRPFVADVIVVNDGSTDDTARLLATFADDASVTVVSYAKNRGKGHALKVGFRTAIERGFDYAITIDSDGQHFPEDLPLFADAMAANPGALLVGRRTLAATNMPGKNTFANYFSNFWFMVQTWQYLPDTQTGYRVYPLHRLCGLRWLTSRYEAELELLVLAAWRGVALANVPIRVYYAPRGERVSHFRPVWDFTRISLLNCVLCVLCICFGWWSIVWHRVWDSRIGRKILTFSFLAYALISALLWPLLILNAMRLMRLESEGAKMWYRRRLSRYFGHLLHAIPRVDVAVDNPHGETFERPCIIVANHQSHIDLLSILSLSPRIVALTNLWVWNFPIYKPVLRYLEYYPATEGLESSVEHLATLTARNYSIVIFPEGTRSADCTILKFHRGAFYLAEKLGCDIVPVYLDGPGRVLPKTDLTLRPGRVTIRIGQRISADDTSMGTNYREKTRAWHRHYVEKFDVMS